MGWKWWTKYTPSAAYAELHCRWKGLCQCVRSRRARPCYVGTLSSCICFVVLQTTVIGLCLPWEAGELSFLDRLLWCSCRTNDHLFLFLLSWTFKNIIEYLKHLQTIVGDSLSKPYLKTCLAKKSVCQINWFNVKLTFSLGRNVQIFVASNSSSVSILMFK